MEHTPVFIHKAAKACVVIYKLDMHLSLERSCHGWSHYPPLTMDISYHVLRAVTNQIPSRYKGGEACCDSTLGPAEQQRQK